MSVIFLFKQKTAYEMRISDWSSDVCSSDLLALARPEIAFTLNVEERTAFRLEACPPGLLDHGLVRLGRILGPDFVKDAIAVRAYRGERSEERRVGKECVSTCGSRGWCDH